jgi:hypothetical protein
LVLPLRAHLSTTASAVNRMNGSTP